jgi:hypothetical protein
MGVNRLNIRTEVEQTAHSGDDHRQTVDIGKANRNTQAVLLRQVPHLNASDEAIDVDRTSIAFVLHNFDTRNRTRTQIADHGIPVVWRPIAQPKRYICITYRRTSGSFAAQRARGSAKEFVKNFIKPAKAAKSSREGNFSHSHFCFVNELLREENPPSLRHGGGEAPKC